MKNRLIITKDHFVSTLGILALFLLWVILTTTFIGGPFIESVKLPAPLDVATAFGKRFSTIVEHSLSTLSLVFTSVFIGSIIGFSVGLIIVYSWFLRKLLTPIVEIFRPCPPIALIPLIVLNFGIGWPSLLISVSIGSFMIFVVTTVSAIDDLGTKYSTAAYIMGASGLVRFTTVIVPSILPAMFVGLRIAAASCFALACAAEYIAGLEGLGYYLRNARNTSNTGVIIICIILLGSFSWALDFLIQKLKDKTCNWINTDKNEKI